MALVHILLVAVVLLTAPAHLSARCGDDPGDAQSVGDARGAVEANCSCAGAASHSAYVRCAAQVAADRAAQGLLRAECIGAVRRCAARSICGRPGSVTCCTVAAGVTRCRRTSDAGRCLARGGTPGTCPSCCDACSGGCSTTTTTSTTSTTLQACGVTGPPLCFGACPPGASVCADVGGTCGCVPSNTPCADAHNPECDGTCPPGEICVTGGFDCGCIPQGTSPCLSTGGQVCAGACPAGVTCTFVAIPDFVGCLCPPTFCGTYPVCGEACPAPKVCTPFQIPSLELCVCQVP